MNKRREKCTIPKTKCPLRDEDGYCSLGYRCHPVIDKCLNGEYGKSCEKIENGYCTVYLFPEAKWRSGNCPMATHLGTKELDKNNQLKTRIGQQKQKKVK